MRAAEGLRTVAAAATVGKFHAPLRLASQRYSNHRPGFGRAHPTSKPHGLLVG